MKISPQNTLNIFFWPLWTEAGGFHLELKQKESGVSILQKARGCVKNQIEIVGDNFFFPVSTN